MLKLSDVEREKEKHLIVAMDMPHYPLLPVVKRETRESGMIIAGDNQKLPLRVYLGNIFGLRNDGVANLEQLRNKYKFIEFNTLDEFLDVGWRVD